MGRIPRIPNAKPPNIRVVLDFDEQETIIYVAALKIMNANSTDVRLREVYDDDIIELLMVLPIGMFFKQLGRVVIQTKTLFFDTTISPAARYTFNRIPLPQFELPVPTCGACHIARSPLSWVPTEVADMTWWDLLVIS